MNDYFAEEKPLQPTKRSNSERQRERRERKARLGIKQVNVEGPKIVRDVVKAIAYRNAKGEELHKILNDIAWKITPEDKRPRKRSQREIDMANYLKKLAYRINSLNGWRRSLVFWIID